MREHRNKQIDINTEKRKNTRGLSKNSLRLWFSSEKAKAAQQGAWVYRLPMEEPHTAQKW